MADDSNIFAISPDDPATSATLDPVAFARMTRLLQQSGVSGPAIVIGDDGSMVACADVADAIAVQRLEAELALARAEVAADERNGDGGDEIVVSGLGAQVTLDSPGEHLRMRTGAIARTAHVQVVHHHKRDPHKAIEAQIEADEALRHRYGEGHAFEPPPVGFDIHRN